MDHTSIPLAHPYTAARHEWDERYGGLITRARNWRIAALLTGVTALLAVAGLLWSAAHSHVVPFVVLVDQLARPIAAGVADETTANDDRLKRAALFGWIENLRPVTIRYYGLLGNRYREKKLARCRQLLGMAPPVETPASEDYRDQHEQLTGSSLRECPACRRGRMVMVETLTAHGSTVFRDTS